MTTTILIKETMNADTLRLDIDNQLWQKDNGRTWKEIKKANLFAEMQYIQEELNLYYDSEVHFVME